jgi:hypothetical protein
MQEECQRAGVPRHRDGTAARRNRYRATIQLSRIRHTAQQSGNSRATNEVVAQDQRNGD